MKKISAKWFDDTFDRVEDIVPYLDKLEARRINLQLNIDLPLWVVESLD
jgi:hypothetical protein